MLNFWQIWTRLTEADIGDKFFLGGVLAERTVADVLIDLGTQLAQIDEVRTSSYNIIMSKNKPFFPCTHASLNTIFLILLRLPPK